MIPDHVAIIMDGNGRWAKKRGLLRVAGHVRGAEVFKQIANCAADAGLRFLTVYAFSSENWRRPPFEVQKLMELMESYLDNAEQELAGRKVSIRIIGDASGFSPSLQEKIADIQQKTDQFSGMRLNLAVNYGARNEIVMAVKSIVADVADNKIQQADIDDGLISRYLYTQGCPDPDIIIRTGGERRLSNFLLYQAAYSELWYTDTLWPDFTCEDFLAALEDYGKRERRFGGIQRFFKG